MHRPRVGPDKFRNPKKTETSPEHARQPAAAAWQIRSCQTPAINQASEGEVTPLTGRIAFQFPTSRFFKNAGISSHPS